MVKAGADRSAFLGTPYSPGPGAENCRSQAALSSTRNMEESEAAVVLTLLSCGNRGAVPIFVRPDLGRVVFSALSKS
jgi:hypothetical protein